MPSLKGMIDQGSLRPLGMTAPNRSDSGLPLISDTVPGFGYSVWYGVFAPVKTPRLVLDQINAVLRKVVADKALQQKLAIQGLEMQSSTPDEFARFMEEDRNRWAKVIEAAKVSVK
jgi:tripartite-type tricarboxylate transporter receptor subunit TctC